tara:strand:+ start:578 stop:856 length:279 start_codon:yes stop_codon:yes gene_type:complete
MTNPNRIEDLSLAWKLSVLFPALLFLRVIVNVSGPDDIDVIEEEEHLAIPRPAPWIRRDYALRSVLRHFKQRDPRVLSVEILDDRDRRTRVY